MKYLLTGADLFMIQDLEKNELVDIVVALSNL